MHLPPHTVLLGLNMWNEGPMMQDAANEKKSLFKPDARLRITRGDSFCAASSSRQRLLAASLRSVAAMGTGDYTGRLSRAVVIIFASSDSQEGRLLNGCRLIPFNGCLRDFNGSCEKRSRSVQHGVSVSLNSIHGHISAEGLFPFPCFVRSFTITPENKSSRLLKCNKSKIKGSFLYLCTGEREVCEQFKQACFEK